MEVGFNPKHIYAFLQKRESISDLIDSLFYRLILYNTFMY